MLVMACMNNSASAMFARLKPLGDRAIRYATNQTFQAQSFSHTTTLPLITKTYEITDKARLSPFKDFSPSAAESASFKDNLHRHLQAVKEMGAISGRHSLYENFEISLLRDDARSALYTICEIPADTQEKRNALDLFISIHKKALPFMDKTDLINAFIISLSHEELPMQFIETLFSTKIPDYINIGLNDISHIISEAKKQNDQTRNEKLNIIQKWAELSSATQRSKETGQSNTGC